MTAFDRPGIRIVRPLAHSSQLETLLVHLADEPPRPAVLARAVDAAGGRLRRTELVALHRARGPAVVPLLDVLDDTEAPALLLAHLAGARLSTVLAEREQWAAGEAVGVLAPLVTAVGRMHTEGVAVAALDPASIVVTADGPVIGDLSRAELFAAHAPEAVLARIPRVGDDRDALRRLAGEVLLRVSGARMHAARMLAELVEGAEAARLCALLEEGLRELAAPVVLPAGEPERAAPPVAAAVRIVPVAAIEERPSDAGVASSSNRIAVLGTALRSRLDALPDRRRRLLVGGGAATVAAAGLLGLWPGTTPERAAPLPASVEHTSTPTPSTRDAATLHADDPLSAVVVLLERRERCIERLSLLCLEEVDQPASAALAADRAGLLALRDGKEARLPSVDPVDARVVERLGDGVLVELGPETAPASLLLMRSEAGWRIRDWVAGGG